MKIEHGARVVDRDGVALGTVDHLARNGWTGELSKFMIWRKPPKTDLTVSPEDVQEVGESEIRLTVSERELVERSPR